MEPSVALTIAGSDSGGGAGLQADLRTFAAHGVLGTCAVTAVTAQNTAAVIGTHVVDPGFVDLQIHAVLSDMAPGAVKTGMLASSATVRAVGKRAAAGDLPNLVVDPVTFASTGRPLLDEEGMSAYLEDLLPFASVATPNIREAAALTGIVIEDVDAMVLAAERLSEVGVPTVVVKGGHLPGDTSPDVVAGEDGTVVLEAARIETHNDHGTGCTLSASIAARLARGSTVGAAVREAKAFVLDAIAGAATWRIGTGRGPLDQLGWNGPGGTPPGAPTNRR